MRIFLLENKFDGGEDVCEWGRLFLSIISFSPYVVLI